MTYDPRDHFDSAYTVFFNGPPKANKIKNGQLGVNIDLFQQVKRNYRKAQHNMPCRVLADICQDILGTGHIGVLEDSALRVSTSVVTIQRWRGRFAESGLLIPHNRNGLYSVDPKVAIRKDDHGNIVTPPETNPLFILDPSQARPIYTF